MTQEGDAQGPDPFSFRTVKGQVTYHKEHLSLVTPHTAIRIPPGSLEEDLSFLEGG